MLENLSLAAISLGITLSGKLKGKGGNWVLMVKSLASRLYKGRDWVLMGDPQAI